MRSLLHESDFIYLGSWKYLSIDNLEIAVLDHCPDDSSECIFCQRVGVVAGNVRTLIFSGHMCRNFFVGHRLTSYSKLKYITINIGTAILCGDRGAACVLNQGHTVDYAEELTSAAKNEIERGAFPELQSLEIVSGLRRFHTEASMRQELGIIHRDILQGKLVV